MWKSLYLILLTLSAVCTFPVTSAVATPSRSCTLPDKVTENITLDGHCTYRGSIVINTSNIVLDCKGATIDAREAKVGIAVVGDRLDNIEVRNCKVYGAQSKGIHVTRPWRVEDAAKSKQTLYDLSPRNIRIVNTTVADTGGVGIYIGSYARDTQITNVNVSRSGGVAVYLDNSSQRAVIQNSVFRENGYGDPLERNRQIKRREGIAIDSSAHNVLMNNKFVENANGGIFLYKNCTEKSSKPGSLVRWQHSSHNKISNNRFISEKIGVFIAARQAKDLSSWDCGDPAIAPGYYRDYADHNAVEGNIFEGGNIGVSIQDDFSTVSNNIFRSQKRACVVLSSPKRDALLGKPVEGTTIAYNRCETPDMDQSGYSAGGKSQFSSCRQNELNGGPFRCNVATP